MVPLKLQAEVFKLSPRVLTSSLSGLSLKKKKKRVSPLPSVSLPLPQDNLLDLQPRMRRCSVSFSTCRTCLLLPLVTVCLQLPTLTKPALKVWGAAPSCREELLMMRETLLPLLISIQKQ